MSFKFKKPNKKSENSSVKKHDETKFDNKLAEVNAKYNTLKKTITEY
jgi:hypothetical protein